MFVGFAGSMLKDALDTIRSDTTAIDKLKGTSFSENKEIGLRWCRSGKMKRRVYFGEGGKVSWRWFVPVMPHFGDLETICGYCVNYGEVWCVSSSKAV